MKLIIHGEPVAQGRPRFRVQKKKTSKGVIDTVRVYDPAKSAKYKKHVAGVAEKCFYKPIEGALSVRIDVFRGIPSSWSKKKREKANIGEIRPTTKPDVDNYAKGVLDGLNKIAFYDDNQIVELTVTKNYSFEPRVEVEINNVD